METQHQTNHHVDVGGTGKLTPGNSNTANTNTPNSNYLCRQSSTRWTPTTEQIRILKDLYYNSGVRSPNADQIQKISARLRQYGKIEGKNVFYWFQNHKARERQKKRFTTTTSSNGVANMGATGPTNDHQLLVPLHRNGGGSGIWKGGNDGEKYGGSFGAPGASCPSSSSAAVGMVSVGQVVGGFGYGHMSMENQLRDCAISACGNGGICNGYPPPHSSGFQLAGVQQYHSSFPHPSSYSFLDGKNCRFQEEDHQFVEEQDHAEIETLPLFPMHGDYHQDSTSNIPSSSFYTPMMRPSEVEPEPYYTNSCHWVNSSSGSTGAAAAAAAARAASLELSLNSYGTHWPNF